MVQVYFSKLNVNSEIYNIYQDRGKLNEILDNVYNNLNQNVTVTDVEIKSAKMLDNSKYFEDSITGSVD